MIRKLTGIFILFLLCGLRLSGQDAGPVAMLDSVQSRLAHIHDYRADIEIEVDVDFIRMPVKHAIMYYREPDIVDFVSEDFFMLPKKGMNFSLNAILSEKYTAIFTGNEYINKEKQYSLKIIPLSQHADIILLTIWINPETYLVTRVDSHTRKHGSYRIDFSYSDDSSPLPSVMTVTFEMEQFKTPVKFLGKDIKVDKEKLQQSALQEGRVIIRYSNYLINQAP